ncbi:MAG: nuclear transport factor 2 family protein, partial [Candidatus Limnocylindrales bacterium]
AAITEQRSAPAGDDGPLPEPPKAAAARAPTSRSRRAEPAPEPEPEPEPEPPPRPSVRITRGRWRSRGDERDAVVAAVRQVTDAWLSDDPGQARDDLHEGMVVSRGDDERIEGRDAVLAAWRTASAEAPATVWIERELGADVVGASAVVRHAFELERDAEGTTVTERGHGLWVFTREGDRWLAAFLMTSVEPPHDR